MKFTKEEISLCKQVAERYKKPIQQGDWILDSDNKPWLVSGVELWKSSRPGLENTIAYDLDSADRTKEAMVVLEKEEIGKYPASWTISDCLEFLKSKIFYGRLYDVGTYYEAVYKKTIIGEDEVDLSEVIWIKATKTPLETLLKVVLAVLEQRK